MVGGHFCPRPSRAALQLTPPLKGKRLGNKVGVCARPQAELWPCGGLQRMASSIPPALMLSWSSAHKVRAASSSKVSLSLGEA